MPDIAAQMLADHIAFLLGETTREVLWGLYGDEIRAALPGATLQTRVGSGRLTQCRHDRLLPGRHTITFGRDMVRSKAGGPTQALRWATGREIARRGFFGGDLTLANLLAQTACHEFAHVLDRAAQRGQRIRPHGPSFYAALKRIHADGAADLVREDLLHRCASERITLEFGILGPAFTGAAAFRSSGDPSEEVVEVGRERFRPGTRVAFQHQNRRFVGRVQRCNRTAATVIPEEPGASYRWFRVPFVLLRAMEVDSVRASAA
jgi:hypothetical protein